MKVTVYNVKVSALGSHYGYAKEYEAKRAQALKVVEMLNLEVVLAPTEEITDPEAYKSWNSFFESAISERVVVTQAQLTMLTVNKITFEFISEVHLDIDPVEVFKEVADKQQMQLTMPDYQGGNTYNNKCEVHMPGNMLASFNEVQLLENSCSDVLQGSLNSGWSLIAACPQPDQRRPDYILGRFNPEKDVGGSAAR